MCGIAGLIRVDGEPVDPVDIQRMTDAIAHRGPDGEGQWLGDMIGLGHRRLAIIDLSEHAAQPMHSADGRYVLTYNGEVYNFPELRRDLERAGSVFTSHSDTEVVLEAVIRWGIDDAVKRFNGMFAFALWDRRERRLVLARDRFGIKPLYLWTSDRTLGFASESKAFLALPWFPAVLDRLGVAEYLTFQNILTDRTFLEGVTVFPPGHWAELCIGDGERTLRRHQYWDITYTDDAHERMTSGEAAEGLRAALDSAVGRQLTADVEVGAYLSGGLDSGGVVALASRRVDRMKTFTCGFDLTDTQAHEAGVDERRQAEMVARELGTEQYEVVIGPRELREALPRVVAHMDEPRVGQSYPNLYAAKLASRFVKVALAGTGGDEILGGYPWRYPPVGLAPAAARDWHFDRWQRLLSPDEVLALLRPLGLTRDEFDPRAIHAALFDRARNAVHAERTDPWTATAMYFEAKTFLPGLLDVEDRLSMAFGLEARVPFLDNEVVDFAGNLPRSWLVSGRKAEQSTLAPPSLNAGKALLRAGLAGLLPEDILTATKQGFSAPDGSWFATTNRDFLADRVSAADRRLMDADISRQLVARHIDGTRQSRLLMWSLLVLAEWPKAHRCMLPTGDPVGAATPFPVGRVPA